MKTYANLKSTITASLCCISLVFFTPVLADADKNTASFALTNATDSSLTLSYKELGNAVVSDVQCEGKSINQGCVLEKNDKVTLLVTTEYTQGITGQIGTEITLKNKYQSVLATINVLLAAHDAIFQDNEYYGGMGGYTPSRDDLDTGFGQQEGPLYYTGGLGPVSVAYKWIHDTRIYNDALSIASYSDAVFGNIGEPAPFAKFIFEASLKEDSKSIESMPE